MNNKIIVLFINIIFGLTTNTLAVIPIDNFESYSSNTDLQAVWEWTGVISGNQMNISLNTSGGANSTQAMQVDFSFSNGQVNPKGYSGGYVSGGNPANWSGLDGIRLWLKATEMGDSGQYIQLALHEGNGGSGNWGDKMESAKVYINNLDSAGEYIFLSFSDFTHYDGFGGNRDNGILELDDIRSIFVFSKYDGNSNQSSAASIFFDDIIVEGITPPVRYPYLQNATQTSIKVLWGSNEPTGKVFWGSAAGDYPNSASSVAFQDNSGVYVHTATISGLTAGEIIYYYVQDGVSGNIGYNDTTYYAASAPISSAPFRMAVYSDSQGDPSYETQHPAVISAMLPHNPDLVLSCGDISDDGQVWEFNDYFFSNAAPLIKNTPIYTTIGNHDVRVKRSDRTTFENDVRNYRDLFDLPINSDDGTEDYYSFDYGSVHAISLNTEQIRSGTGYTNTTRTAAMKNWLINDLSATDKPWKVVFFHKPVYLDFIYSEGWTQIFEQYGVQIVFFGHLHGFYANHRNGVVYMTSAGGGGPIGAAPWWAWPNERIGAFSDYNFTQIDVTQTELSVKVYNEKDVLRQSFDLDVLGNLTNNVVIPADEEVDDFELYTDAIDFQESWDWYGGLNGGSLQRYYDTGGASGNSNLMRMEVDFTANSINPFGYCGYTGLWDWVDYSGVKLWIKATQTGAAHDFQIRLHEGSGGDKWMYSIPIADLDANGGYILAPLSDFVWYGDNGSPDNIKNMDRIVSFFVGAGFDSNAQSNGASTIFVDDITAVIDTLAITDLESVLPKKFALRQNYPNPFNPVTTILYDIPKTGNVRLIIYDLLGREVTRLVNDRMEAGYHKVQWNGRNQFGEKVTSGIYIYLLKAEDFTESKKLLLLK